MAASGDDLVNSIKDTLSGKSVRDSLSGAVDRAKSYLGIKGAPPAAAPPPKPDTSWHDDAVDKANASFKADTKEPPKPLPKYDKGTDYVPETGPAILHKGEAVLNKEDAEKHRRKMASPEKSLSKKKKTSKKKSSPKHKIRSTHIEHGEDGSHVVRHSFDQGDGDEQTPDSVHGISDSDGLLAHLQSQLGGQLPPQGGDAGAGGAGGGMPPQAPPQAPPQGM